MTLAELLLKPFRSDQPSYGDHDTFAGLYDQTYRHVFRYVYALSGGPVADVEDVVADTFLRAWNKRQTFSGSEDDAIGWLITIARRLVFDRHRRTKHAPVRLLGGDQGLIDSCDPAASITEREQTAKVVALLNNLSPTDRELLTLRYILNWPVHRIADHLKKSPNTISVALRRALDRSREHMSMHL